VAKKTFQENSKFQHLDEDNDGIVSDDELSRAERAMELANREIEVANRDAKEDQIRWMMWWALGGLVCYPMGIFLTSLFGLEVAAKLIADIAGTYFVAVAGLVSVFMSAQAYTKNKE